MKGGIVDVLGVAPVLFDPVKSGVARSGFIGSKEYLGLDQAPEAYRRFNKQLETKVLFKFPWCNADSEKRIPHSAESMKLVENSILMEPAGPLGKQKLPHRRL